MNDFLRLISASIIMITFMTRRSYSSTTCELPRGCHLGKWLSIKDQVANQALLDEGKSGVRCDIENAQYRFEDFASSSSVVSVSANKSTTCESRNFSGRIEMRFPRRKNLIIQPQLGMQSVIDLILMSQDESKFRFSNLNGFDVDVSFDFDHLRSDDYLKRIESKSISVEFINTRFEFYRNGQVIRSCSEMSSSYNNSVFQISGNAQESLVYFVNCEFKEPVCPLIFRNAILLQLFISPLFNYFFKRNVLTFTNNTFQDLNANIKMLFIYHAHNIDIDSRLLNPSVFKKLMLIVFQESYNSI